MGYGVSGRFRWMGDIFFNRGCLIIQLSVSAIHIISPNINCSPKLKTKHNNFFLASFPNPIPHFLFPHLHIYHILLVM